MPMTLLVTIEFVSVKLFQGGDESFICEGSLHVLEDLNQGLIILSVGDFKYALDGRISVMKAFDYLEYTFPHSEPGDEYAIEVLAIKDGETILVLDSCLELYSKFTKQADTYMNRAARLAKRASRAISARIKTGIKLARESLNSFKRSTLKNTTLNPKIGESRAQQLIDEARRDPNRQVSFPSASVKALVSTAATIKCPVDPESLAYSIGQSVVALQSAITCAANFAEELKEWTEENVAESMGMNPTQLKGVKCFVGSSVGSIVKNLGS